MIGDLFENDSGSFGSNSTGTQKRGQDSKPKKRYIADDMDLPPVRRNPGEFSGLLNQGATCYLNALFQTYFFTPQFKRLLFSIDLDGTDTYEKHSDKYNVIKQFQLFFARLKYLGFKNQSTMSLTASFGWDAGEFSEQQDVAESMRVIMDTMERALFDCGKSDEFRLLFKGVTANYIQTLTCQTTKERNEDFMDLMLPIKNYQGNKFKSIDESISFMLTPELMEGRDQYDCSVCGQKVDALRGIKFGHLPEVLTLSLMRFDINYSTYERIKINDYYAFDLRLDMAKYSGKADDVYDLYAVMVHRGDAYSGHYHVIIRDVDGLRNEIQGLTSEEPVKTEEVIQNKKQYNVPDSTPLTEAQISRLNKLFPAEIGKKPKGDHAVPPAHTSIPHESKHEESEDPFPTKVVRDPSTEYLFHDWYDFDDSRVTKFNVNKMHKYFGNSKESAFLLVYRKTSLHTGSVGPKVLVPPPSVLNQVLKEEKDLKQTLTNYELFKEKLRIHVAEADTVYNFETGQILSGASKDLIVDFQDCLMAVRQRVKAELGLNHDDWCLIEYESNEPDPAILVRLLAEDGPNQPIPHTVKSLKLHHDSFYFVIPYDHPQYIFLGSKLTLGKTLTNVKVKVGKEEYEMLIPKYACNKAIRDEFQNFCDWDLRLHDIFVIDFAEKKGLLEIPISVRGNGIPYRDFEFVLQKTEDLFSAGGLQLVENKDYTYQENEDQFSMLIFRDDDQNEGGSKFIVKADMDVKGLITMLKKYYEIEDESMRRIRDLSNQRLFTKEDLSVTLREIRSQGAKGESLVLERIRLERGPIPDRGGFSCRVKLDLIAENGEKIKLAEELILYLHNTVEEVFTRACSRLNARPEEYSLYLCNWAEEPTKKLKTLGNTLEQEGILETTIFKLMHNTQGLSDEIRSYEVHYSASGMPNDLKIIGKISVNENLTLKDLKKSIKDLCNKENGFETEFGLEHMMLRRMNKAMKPSKVLCEDSKTIKKLKINCLGLCFTIFSEKVNCSPHELRIYIRERFQADKSYGSYNELVLNKSKDQNLSIDDLKRELIAFKKCDPGNVSEVLLLRYNPKEYLWLRLSEASSNITKKPYFIEDGDVIGFMFLKEGETLPNDDFQTEDDREMRRVLEVGREDTKGKVEETGFKMKVDF